MIRKPAVAGRFYPGTASELHNDIESMIDLEAPRDSVIGLISPHAGYIYSGTVAGAVFSRIEIPDTCIILGPNHRGAGAPYAMTTRDGWETPLGIVELDSELGILILQNSEFVMEDHDAHDYEHSIEVQLPFLQYLNENVKIVPVALTHTSGDIYKQIGKSIAEAINKLERKVLIIASSDMSHYESSENAKTKDMKAIDAILELDEDKLLKQVEMHSISMCGYGPVMSLISAAKDLGAQDAELIMYQTSGDVSGNYDEVVGYAGVIIK